VVTVAYSVLFTFRDASHILHPQTRAAPQLIHTASSWFTVSVSHSNNVSAVHSPIQFYV